MAACEEDYFYNLFNSGLHGAQWPEKCSAILVYRFKEIYYCLYCQNEGGKHAEELLMDGLSKVLSDCSWEDLSTIIMYINFSPCFKCSRKIILFYDEARAKKYSKGMEIVFAAPYNWTGESCVVCGCTHYKPSGNYSKKMIDGLQELNGVDDIIVRTFGKQDWELLAKNFGITKFKYDDEEPSRKLEDILKREDSKRALEKPDDDTRASQQTGCRPRDVYYDFVPYPPDTRPNVRRRQLAKMLEADSTAVSQSAIPTSSSPSTAEDEGDNNVRDSNASRSPRAIPTSSSPSTAEDEGDNHVKDFNASGPARSVQDAEMRCNIRSGISVRTDATSDSATFGGTSPMDVEVKVGSRSVYIRHKLWKH